MTFVRLGSIAASRDAAAREAADIRTRLEVLKEATADFERDLKQDLANARSEQAAAAQAARTELGATWRSRRCDAAAARRMAPRRSSS